MADVIPKNQFKLLYRVTNQTQQWIKTVRALQIDGRGCVIHFATQQQNTIGTDTKVEWSETSVFVPDVKIVEVRSRDSLRVLYRKLVVSQPSDF